MSLNLNCNFYLHIQAGLVYKEEDYVYSSQTRYHEKIRAAALWLAAGIIFNSSTKKSDVSTTLNY